MCSWRAVRNIFIKIIQPEPSLAPSTVSQGLSKQKKSDRNNLKRKMKPGRGWWLKSLLQCTSRKPGKEAEMQIYPGEAGPVVRRPIKVHPLNPLHLSLPMCSRSSGWTTWGMHRAMRAGWEQLATAKRRETAGGENHRDAKLLWAHSYHSDWCLRNANNSKINNTGQAGRAPRDECELLPSRGTVCTAFSALLAPRWLRLSPLPG